ncbi:TcmI family type II polyketide cyclase [Micromonospora sp. NBC_01699]|uniref:TcmI family type II polyketide cyclase n=1 Tax=Micromonospora sp. NBC_01699 TaxID=2975984 RepID=UPI002E2D3596|nr:TcmI family type II polyketide cyclase [Micromonospora sp. NBC_01699]
MSRLLIVGRMAPGPENGPGAGAEERIAQIFAESDQTELPAITGARHRSLYTLGDLYLHLVELDGAGPAGLPAAAAHPLFVQLNERLSSCTTPYLSTWRSPRDAMARCFYSWDAPVPAQRSGQ